MNEWSSSDPMFHFCPIRPCSIYILPKWFRPYYARVRQTREGGIVVERRCALMPPRSPASLEYYRKICHFAVVWLDVSRGIGSVRRRLNNHRSSDTISLSLSLYPSPSFSLSVCVCVSLLLNIYLTVSCSPSVFFSFSFSLSLSITLNCRSWFRILRDVCKVLSAT